MKSVFIFAMILLFSSPINYEWETDFEVAKSKALELDRKIVLVFQGSDWCGPCIKLSREIWDTEEFGKYAASNYVMLQADFPKRKKNALSDEHQERNNQLAEKYNPNGYFPFVVVLDKNGKVLGETGYQKKTPSEFIAILESF